MALCSITLEHHGAVIVLLESGQHPGSALALLRPLIETCIRAFWLMYCADDGQIAKIADGSGAFPTLEKCGEAVSLHFSNQGHPGLFSLTKNYRSQLHGLTHSGLEQLQHRFDSKLQIKPTYPDKTLSQLVRTATEWLAMSAIAQVEVVEDMRLPRSARFSEKFLTLFGDDGSGQRLPHP
jgi:hypothetical protein